MSHHCLAFFMSHCLIITALRFSCCTPSSSLPYHVLLPSLLCIPHMSRARAESTSSFHALAESTSYPSLSHALAESTSSSSSTSMQYLEDCMLCANFPGMQHCCAYLQSLSSFWAPPYFLPPAHTTPMTAPRAH
eukprot:1152962-Pelagomonas_calceolata.AAC.2